MASPWSARRLAPHPRPHRVRGFSCAHRNTVRRVILALVARSFALRGPIGGARRLVSPPLQRIEPAAAQQDAEEKSESEAARRSSRSFHDMPHSPSGSPESPRSRRPAPSSARFIFLPTTRASRLTRPAKARPSRPFPASSSARSCASRRSGRSAATIGSPTARSNCRSRSPMRLHFVRARSGPRLSRRLARRLPRTRCIGRLRRESQAQDDRRRPSRRLNPLGGETLRDTSNVKVKLFLRKY